MNIGKQSERAYVNKHACIMFTIVTVLLALAYTVQFLQGSKTPLIFAVLLATDLLPVVAAWLIYKQDESSEVIKHVMGIGYGLFYAISCFTSTEQQVYVYAIPMILVVTMYCDFKYSVTISGGVGIIALIHSIWYTAGQGWSKEAVAAMEIELVVMIVIAIFSILTNRIMVMLNENKVTEINEVGDKTERMLSSVMSISGELVDEVSMIADKMTILGASSEETLAAIQEIQSSTTDTAESVQTQLYKTEEIQTQIDKVTNAANSIGENVTVTVDACHEGRDNIGKLISQAKVSEEAGNKVMSEVEDLKASTAQMQTIVELIKSVASQTSLLALNASIEAARAGEAGRGFAVVATEISNLAGQTQTATGNISELIEGISKEMSEVVSAIDSLVSSNRIQNESAEVTAGSFEKIVESIRSIRTNSSELSDIVTKLVSANQEIVDSIQTISAITEEVSAHSSNTCEATEQNEEIVEEVQTIVEQMSKYAEELKALK